MCFPLFSLCKWDHATLSCFEHSKGRKPGKHEGASRTAHTAVEITVGWRKGWRQNSRKIALSLPYQQRTVHSSPGKSQPANFPLFEQMLQRLWRVHREWHPVGRDVNSFVGLKCTKKQVSGPELLYPTCIETSQNDQPVSALVPQNQNLDTKRQELAPGHQESERELFFHVISWSLRLNCGFLKLPLVHSTHTHTSQVISH